MAQEPKRRSLGKGLSSLLGDPLSKKNDTKSEVAKPSNVVPVEFLHPGRYQPRQKFDKDQIRELAQSIKDKGILQPLLVRKHPDKEDAFEIIAGERRWQAAQEAQLHEVPVIIREFSDKETLEVALVENLQREDLSVLEEAKGYNRLMEEFSHTQEELAKVVGKSRSHVANTLRLLGLPEPVRQMLDDGKLSAGHARALLGTESSLPLAEMVINQGLNVRQTEKLVQKSNAPKKPLRPKPVKDPDTVVLENDITNLLGLKTEIDFKGNSGTLTVKYKTLEQLDDILERLSRGGSMTGS
ncbi:MAG: ParB/RepB/Spo0J family partition protein [Rhodospirillaceae bacterium]|jgi:ParB family chromosome partitioning protein|nr:ParB/RepB/Spo0J family partition protein [Rhodospirillales bacterium]MBT3904677.1 ParB/RepB/Spo0J family partition protein [Rhodospirillaceae bacterium]MBT4701383.1 ParB/RepB/Spo0J family partition protein [Rhodospirillaceae bacterium]MBT5036211.1 ParB/RepB/Spo0J family partition protein [Rhodospirillaceae bacterium]MBT6220725.1 ParB/RepB/Spo0J family partition protein [Rhodospirillaceae bacterium]